MYTPCRKVYLKTLHNGTEHSLFGPGTVLGLKFSSCVPLSGQWGEVVCSYVVWVAPPSSLSLSLSLLWTQNALHLQIGQFDLQKTARSARLFSFLLEIGKMKKNWFPDYIFLFLLSRTARDFSFQVYLQIASLAVIGPQKALSDDQF